MIGLFVASAHADPPRVDVHVEPGASEWVIEVVPATGAARTVRVAAPRTSADQLAVLALIESLSAEIELPLAGPPPPLPAGTPPPPPAPAPAPRREVVEVVEVHLEKAEILPTPAQFAVLALPAPARLPEPPPEPAGPGASWRAWGGAAVDLRPGWSAGPGIELGVAQARAAWVVGVRTELRPARATRVAPETEVDELRLDAEVGRSVPGFPPLRVVGSAGLTRRRFVQSSETASDAVFPTIAVGVGLEPQWSGLGLSMSGWIEQDLARTVVHVDPGGSTTVASTSARIAARIWVGR